MRWFYATGLRLADITSVKCEDQELAEYQTVEAEMAPDWMLSVIGKGGLNREVPVSAELVEELGNELARHGNGRDVTALSNESTLNRPGVIHSCDGTL